MSRALKYDIPGPDWRRSVGRVAADGWESAFAPDVSAPLRLVVEIGFCRGEFLMEMARQRAQHAFVGVEVSFKRVLKMARRLAPTEIRNVRLLEAPGEEIVGTLFEPSSVEEVWINFPDPWPKGRHAHRRIVQPPFAARIASCLVDGGVFYVATDSEPYACQIRDVLSADSRLVNTVPVPGWRSEVPGRMPTAYQRAWRDEGRSLHFFAFERVPRTDATTEVARESAASGAIAAGEAPRASLVRGPSGDASLAREAAAPSGSRDLPATPPTPPSQS